MELDFSTASTNELVTIDRINTTIVDLLIGSLREQYPGCRDLFFPHAGQGPDFEYASTYGEETLQDVRYIAEAAWGAILAREELARRGRLN